MFEILTDMVIMKVLEKLANNPIIKSIDLIAVSLFVK